MSVPTISVSEDGKHYVTKGGIGPMFPGVLRYLLRIPGPSGFGSSSTSDQVTAKWNGEGKVAIVTGAAGGLGFDAVRALAKRGCEVVVTARDQAKAEEAISRLRKVLPAGAKLIPMGIDLSDQSSIKAFAAAFLAMKKPLNILINNAGVMAIPKFTTTKDGYESQLGVNHFGHWTLTQLLLPTLIETAKSSGVQGRVVCVSSSMHHASYAEGIRIEGYNDPKLYVPWRAYGQSKLANVLFVRELALRLNKAGAPVAVYTLHPGGINTGLQRDMGSCGRGILMSLGRPFLKSVPQGSATEVYAATMAPGSIPSGEYMDDCNLSSSSAQSHDATLGRALWDLSIKATGVPAAV